MNTHAPFLLAAASLLLAACSTEPPAEIAEDAPTAKSMATKGAAADKFADLSNAELEVLAKTGDAEAQVALGLRYANDKGDEAYSARAFELFKAAADQGDAAGQYFVGVSYANGKGVPKNDVEAVRWYEKSAKQNYASAQYWMGFMIAHGRGGIVQSWEGAYSYLRRAADQGHVSAMVLLGQMYTRGQGVEQNYETAARYYRTANATRFSQFAQYNLLSLIKRGLVQWQPGDPGKPPAAADAGAQSAEQPAAEQPAVRPSAGQE